MELNQVTQLISQHHVELKQHAVKTLAVFGSVARSEATPVSDIDVLVEFSQPVGLFEFIRLKNYLEGITKCEVDLVTQDALHPTMHDSILNECIYIFNQE